MFTLAGVKEAMSTGILIGVSEGQLVSDWIFLEESERVTDADVVVRPREKSRTIEV